MILLKNFTPVLLYLLLISFGSGCQTTTFGQTADSLFLTFNEVDFFYDLKRPESKYPLPYVLEEVSGLTYKHPNGLLAVDDESGKIFEYDLISRKIIHSITFFKPDDYEGVELVNNQIYVLKNDGDIFQFPYDDYKKTQAKKTENTLSSKNDTEGLGFDPQLNSLLIACKEAPGTKDVTTKGRAFYQLSLENLGEPELLFNITPDHMKLFWEKNKNNTYEANRIKFKPSAIAVHPISGNYYILSSVGKMLLVTNKAGVIKATYPISPRVLGQPEGICFDHEGGMYISSEGEGDRGYILKFPMQAKPVL